MIPREQGLLGRVNSEYTVVESDSNNSDLGL